MDVCVCDLGPVISTPPALWCCLVGVIKRLHPSTTITLCWEVFSSSFWFVCWARTHLTSSRSFKVAKRTLYAHLFES